MASSSSSSRRWRRALEEPPQGPPPPGVEAKGWADLPRDVLLAVLHMLGQAEVLTGPGQVCGPWRRAARDEPELWRRVKLRFPAGLSSRADLSKVGRDAVRLCSRLTSGQCEAFLAQGAADCSVLSQLVDSAALSLRSLRLISYGIYDSMRLVSVMTKFSLLEELELSNCWGAFPETLAAVGKTCPLLTRLRLSSKRFIKREPIDVVGGEVTAIATTMPALRSLQLFANRLGNRGLVTILDGCPRLESLDIRHCFNVVMDDEICARCSWIEMLRLPGDSTDDYDLEFSSPEMDPPEARRPEVDFDEDEWGLRR